MKKKNILTLLIACFTTVYIIAQCRVVRGESTDSLKFFYYGYAPEGYLKRHTRLSNDKYGGEVLEMAWDLASIPIDPERTFFADSPLDLLSDWTIPTVPLSVKGNLKGRTTYKIEKDGKLTKQYSEELFDNKANASGYLVENKYKTSPDNKVVTFRAFFEGCKN